MKKLTIALCVFSLFTFSGFAPAEFLMTPTSLILDHSGPNISQIPDPTISICSLQFNDRWNAQRTILNRMQLNEEEQFAGHYANFKSDFLMHEWLPEIEDQQLTQFETDLQPTRSTQRCLYLRSRCTKGVIQLYRGWNFMVSNGMITSLEQNFCVYEFD